MCQAPWQKPLLSFPVLRLLLIRNRVIKHILPICSPPPEKDLQALETDSQRTNELELLTAGTHHKLEPAEGLWEVSTIPVAADGACSALYEDLCQHGSLPVQATTPGWHMFLCLCIRDGFLPSGACGHGSHGTQVGWLSPPPPPKSLAAGPSSGGPSS